jgi:hypothetical protein
LWNRFRSSKTPDRRIVASLNCDTGCSDFRGRENSHFSSEEDNKPFGRAQIGDTAGIELKLAMGKAWKVESPAGCNLKQMLSQKSGNVATIPAG